VTGGSDDSRREQATRAVLEHESGYPSRWAAIGAIADMFQLSPSTLRDWVRRADQPREPAPPPAHRAKRGRPAGVPTGETRQRILDAARACMAEVGARATLHMVAERSGLSANAIYHYFPSKRAMFEAVVDLNEREFWSTMGDAVVGASSLSEELVGLVNALDEFLRRNPTFSVLIARSMPRVMLDEHPIPPRARAFCEGFADRAVERSEITRAQHGWLVGFIAANLMGVVMVQPTLRQPALDGLRWFFAHAPLVAEELAPPPK
jgi:AcrR family transcriptional regulator